MLNCKEASQLASRAQDEELQFWEKMTLKLHLLLCHSCAHFTQQLSFIRKASHHAGTHHHFHLTAEAKQQILQALKKKNSS
jgi:hypothetical protein